LLCTDFASEASASITPIYGWDNSTVGYTPEPEGIQGVGFWPRVGARLIDTIAHFFVGLFTGTLFRVMLLVASGGHVPPAVVAKLSHGRITSFLFALLGVFAYHVIFDTVHGSTLGKLALSMVVVQKDGSPCRLKSALIRELGYYVDALFFGMIGYIAMERTPERQRYGDEWAHTIVCKRSVLTPDKLRGGGRFALALFFALMAETAFILTGMLVRTVG
jgi:uncharacterized RDD family membrane protein YckC